MRYFQSARAQKAHQLTVIVAFLLPRYTLADDVVRDLAYSGFSVSEESTARPATPRAGITSLDVLLSETKSVAAQSAGSDDLVLQICRIPLRLALCEWTSAVKEADHDMESSLSDHADTKGAIMASIDSLSQTLEQAYYVAGRPELDTYKDLLVFDLQHLVQWARRLLDRHGAVFRNPAHTPGIRGTSPEEPRLQGEDKFQPYAAAREPPGGGHPSGPGRYEAYHRHIQRKVDQIAYVTIILLSMTFIATVYGMNLNIFTDGGLVSLNSFLATSLPFTAGLFFVTFFPDMLSSTHGRSGLRVETV